MSALLARHDGADVVAFGGLRERTAGELSAYARAVASALSDLPPAAQVVLACSDRYCFAAALLGLWQRGLRAVLPANGQPETVRALARSSHIAGLLRDRDDGLGLDVRALEPARGDADPSVTVATARAGCALTVYTSGSTGTPVAHDKTLAQLLDESWALIEAFALERRRVLTAVPPHHIYGLLFGVLVPLLGGGSFSRAAKLQPAGVLRDLVTYGADVLVTVPAHLSALAQYGTLAEQDRVPRPFPAVHRVFSSAAPLTSGTERTLRSHGVVVTQVLGSTETGGIASRTSCDAPWHPLPFVRVALAEGQTMRVSSPWSSREPNQPVVTADRIELLAQGFRHLGRADAVVKVAGRRVDMGDLEARLKTVEGVRDARVLGVESPGLRGTELCAVVEANAERVPVHALKQALSAHFDPVTLPRRYRVVSELPRNAAGKTTRHDLLSLFDTWELPSEPLGCGSVSVRVPVNCGFFRGHFDAQPMLPGVVQLQHLALREARRSWPELGTLARLTRVKFKRPIRPGDELVLSLERKGDAQVQFTMRCGREPAASGTFHFRRPPA